MLSTDHYSVVLDLGYVIDVVTDLEDIAKSDHQLRINAKALQTDDELWVKVKANEETIVKSHKDVEVLGRQTNQFDFLYLEGRETDIV
jgi:hypothetical protein